MSTHVSSHVTLPPPASPVVRPRELGIYELPDGREFVVSTLYSGGCGLYPTRAWHHYGVAEYRVDRQGRLCNLGKPTGWRVTDLFDTGRTAKYPAPVIR